MQMRRDEDRRLVGLDGWAVPAVDPRRVVPPVGDCCLEEGPALMRPTIPAAPTHPRPHPLPASLDVGDLLVCGIAAAAEAPDTWVCQAQRLLRRHP